MGRHSFVTNPLPFTPITIPGVTARNRVMVSPMCRCATVEGGSADRTWRGCAADRRGMHGAP